MKLYEHEAKTIFQKHEIPIPRGEETTSSTLVREVSVKLGVPVAIKAQILVSGRGKAGGILFANSPEEAETAAKRLLGTEIKGVKVKEVLVEEKIAAKKELYFGITTDRTKCSYVAIASSEGGMDIEEVAANMPERIIKVFIDPTYGFRSYHAYQIGVKLGYVGSQLRDLAAVFLRLYKIAMDYDAELIEINPLIETVEGKFVAADSRILIDDNALYRHPEYKEHLIHEVETELSAQEVEAQKTGLAYVKLDGNIGIIGNGAGLVMATLDAVQFYGGRPANFLDVGGGASADMMASALNIVLSDPKVEVVFINILGGITRCDEVAKGILEAKKRVGFTKPIVIRLVGTNEEEGRRILTEAGIHFLDSMEEAAMKAVEIAKTGG
jgi:succinyl-CoA synthetase beta subunit